MFNIKQICFCLSLLGILGITSCTRTSGNEAPDTSKSKINHLIIKEVFYIGHELIQKRTGDKHFPEVRSFYNDDQYIVIYNPTDKVKYLDGLGLAINGVDPEVRYEFVTGSDFRDKYFGASSLAIFPTKKENPGKSYPIMPGESKIVAAFATNHSEQFKEQNADATYPYEGVDKLFDLSKADFEWTNQKDLFTEDKKMNNVNVPDMHSILRVDDEPIFAFPRLLNEHCCLALIEVPWTWQDFRDNAEPDLRKGKPGYIRKIEVTNGASLPAMVEIPFNKVIDCITLCPSTLLQMQPCQKLDKGYNSITDINLIHINEKLRTKYSGLCLTRKWDGKKFIDSNNTTQDFEVKPALGTAQKNKK